jgi:hypothetical protein
MILEIDPASSRLQPQMQVSSTRKRHSRRAPTLQPQHHNRRRPHPWVPAPAPLGRDDRIGQVQHAPSCRALCPGSISQLAPAFGEVCNARQDGDKRRPATQLVIPERATRVSTHTALIRTTPTNPSCIPGSRAKRGYPGRSPQRKKTPADRAERGRRGAKIRDRRMHSCTHARAVRPRPQGRGCNGYAGAARQPGSRHHPAPGGGGCPPPWKPRQAS